MIEVSEKSKDLEYFYSKVIIQKNLIYSLQIQDPFKYELQKLCLESIAMLILNGVITLDDILSFDKQGNQCELYKFIVQDQNFKQKIYPEEENLNQFQQNDDQISQSTPQIQKFSNLVLPKQKPAQQKILPQYQPIIEKQQLDIESLPNANDVVRRRIRQQIMEEQKNSNLEEFGYCEEEIKQVLQEDDLNNKLENISIKSKQEPFVINKNMDNESQFTMQISATTQKDLNIFEDQFHPSLMIKNQQPKEGYSLFNLFDFTVSIKGREYLKYLFNTPLNDMDRILFRQRSITLLQRLDLFYQKMVNNQDGGFYGKIQVIIKNKYQDIEQIIKNWERERILDGKGIIKLVESIKQFYLLDNIFLQIFEKIDFQNSQFESYCNSDLYQSYSRIQKDKLRKLGNIIIRGVDLELAKTGKINISRGVSEDLDDLRDRHLNLDKEMSLKLKQLADHDIHQLPEFMWKVRMIAIPSVGYFTVASKKDTGYYDFVNSLLLQMKAENPETEINEEIFLKVTMEPILKKLGWKLCFISENEIYFQNRATKEMNQTQGDLYSKIKELEFHFISVIQKEIISMKEVLLEMNEFVIKLDAYVSMFMAALEFQLVRPHYSKTANRVVLKKARNLLVEFKNPVDYSPQDYSLSASQITIVCGQNGSGKSIYLKNIGSLIYLAQIGSYIPCQKMTTEETIPVFNKILTKFQTQEDIDHQKQSYFYKEASSINEIIEQSDSHSLILVDEYARGTSHINGMTLVQTFVETFSQEKLYKQVKGYSGNETLPLVFLSTNITEVFSQQSLSQSDTLKYHQMKPRSSLNILESGDTLDFDVFMKKLLFEKEVTSGIDVAELQNLVKPIECAEKTDIDQKIIQRAKFIQKGISVGRRIQAKIDIEQRLLDILIVSYQRFKKELNDGSEKKIN